MEEQKLSIFERVQDLVAPDFMNAAEWLNRPHPMLYGDMPQEAISSGDQDSVNSILEHLQHGIPT